MDNFGQMGFMSLVLIGFAIKAAPWVGIAVAVGLPAFAYCTYCTDAGLRECRRMANNAVSPVMTCISEVKQGAPLIRAMRLNSFFRARQTAFIDTWVRYYLYSRYFIVWGAYGSAFLSSLVGGTMISVLLATRESRSFTETALGLTYAGFLPYFTTIVAELFVQTRTGLTCLERLLEYQSLPQEAPHAVKSDPESGEWPSRGAIVFQDVSMRYRPGLPLALEGFSVSVPAQQKVGIVGRTGAGKSTLMLALFRL